MKVIYKDQDCIIIGSVYLKVAKGPFLVEKKRQKEKVIEGGPERASWPGIQEILAFFFF